MILQEDLKGVPLPTSSSTLPIIDQPTEEDGTPSIPINPSSVLHRSLLAPPQRISSSSGLYLYPSTGGPPFLDATGGAAVACLGHNHPAIKFAILKQLDSVAYTGTIFYSTPAAEELCSILIDSTNNQMSRVFLCNSGSEANEAAMKMARQFFVERDGIDSPRCKFISRRQSYHGATIASLGLGGHVLRRKIYEPLLGEWVSRVSPCYAYRGKRTIKPSGTEISSVSTAEETRNTSVNGDENGAICESSNKNSNSREETDQEYVARLLDELDAEFQRVDPSTVCAFIAEPVVGAALGCVPSLPGYFAGIRRICDKHGALLIFDEVMCGMGRTGYLHAWQDPTINVVPDLQTLGKGLSSGYQPVAALLVNHAIVDALSTGSAAFSHGQTYQAHPVGAAAAVAVLKIIRQPTLLSNVRKLGKLLEQGLRTHLEHRWYVGDIRGKGLFWGIEFVKDKRTKEPFDPSLQVAMGVHRLGMEEPHMISLYPGTGCAGEGMEGDFVLLAPMYICSGVEIELIVERAVGCIEAWFGGRKWE